MKTQVWCAIATCVLIAIAIKVGVLFSGCPFYKIDAVNLVKKVGGVDQMMAEIRAAIGG